MQTLPADLLGAIAMWAGVFVFSVAIAAGAIVDVILILNGAK